MIRQHVKPRKSPKELIKVSPMSYYYSPTT
nr:MAG TPA_asm: hypothetical protein [Caudoviricetes sp.]